MQKLALMPVVERLSHITPAVMYEVAAARYMHIAIQEFREKVKAGEITCRHWPGKKRRIYLKADLDDYLSRLEKGNIGNREVSPIPFPKQG